MTTPAPEVRDRRRLREAGQTFYATQDRRPPTLSPDVVQSISAGGPAGGGPAAAPGVDPALSKTFGAGLAPRLQPGEARAPESGDRRTDSSAPGLSTGKDTRDGPGRG